MVVTKRKTWPIRICRSVSTLLQRRISWTKRIYRSMFF